MQWFRYKMLTEPRENLARYLSLFAWETSKDRNFVFGRTYLVLHRQYYFILDVISAH